MCRWRARRSWSLGQARRAVRRAGDGLWKLRCGGGLAVACEGDYIGELALGCHLAQLCLERFEYHGSRVIRLMAGALGVEAVLAVDAVERADFAAGRHHVDAERETKATAANGPKDGLAFKNVDIGICSSRQLCLSIASAPKQGVGSCFTSFVFSRRS